MRVGMSLFQNEHSVWCVRKKVPEALEQAVATVLGNGKKRQPWLQRSLRTKDKQEAKRLAPPVLMEFDRILADAEASTAERPLRTTLDRREIERIADYSTPMNLRRMRKSVARADRKRSSKMSRNNYPTQGCISIHPTPSGQYLNLVYPTARWTRSTNRLRPPSQLPSSGLREAISRRCVGRSMSCSSSFG